ncbi:MAG: response regulator transcription factor [Acidobacteriales bacterium]|nr:response regulator transcription factor [Terriglobales bacterium]
MIVAAVRAVARGEGWFSSAVASQIAAWARGERLDPTGLTGRQLEVLEAMAKGWTNAYIAKNLGISARTVAFHVRSLLNKLDASNRTEAVAKALNYGWINNKDAVYDPS